MYTAFLDLIQQNFSGAVVMWRSHFPSATGLAGLCEPPSLRCAVAVLVDEGEFQRHDGNMAVFRRGRFNLWFCRETDSIRDSTSAAEYPKWGVQGSEGCERQTVPRYTRNATDTASVQNDETYVPNLTPSPTSRIV